MVSMSSTHQRCSHGTWRGVVNSVKAHSSDAKASHRTGRSSLPSRGESFTSPCNTNENQVRHWQLSPQVKMQWALRVAGCAHSAVVVWGSLFESSGSLRGLVESGTHLPPLSLRVARRCCLLSFRCVGVHAAFGSMGIESSPPLSCQCILGCMDYESRSTRAQALAQASYPGV